MTDHADTIRPDELLRDGLVAGLNGLTVSAKLGWEILHRWDALLAERQQAIRGRDELGPLFVRDMCRLLDVDEDDFLRLDKAGQRLKEVVAERQQAIDERDAARAQVEKLEHQLSKNRLTPEEYQAMIAAPFKRAAGVPDPKMGDDGTGHCKGCGGDIAKFNPDCEVCMAALEEIG